MVFRDDVGALRARCDALERELEQSHKQQNRLLEEASEKENLESRAEELQAQLDELREQIQRGRKPEPFNMSPAPPPRSMALFAATMAVLVGGFTLHVLAASHRQQMSAYHYHHTMAERARAIEEQRELENLRRAAMQPRDEKGRTTSPLLFETEVRTGRVVRTFGDTTVQNGDSCTVDLVSTREYHEFNCRAEVRCGSTIIYGGPDLGYMMCGFENNRATYAREQGSTEQDGDPRITLDLLRDHVVVSDGPQHRFAVEVALE